jgi:hypothetical protein
LDNNFRDTLFAENIGTITILTDNHILFQGQLGRDDARQPHEFEHHHEEKEKEKYFEPPKDEKCCDPRVVVLKLTCDPAIIKPDGKIRKIRPQLFEEGDIIRINVFEIVAVGPSLCCFSESESEESEESEDSDCTETSDSCSKD